MKRMIVRAALCLMTAGRLGAADNLRVNPKLNLMKNGDQGRLILGDHLGDGIVKGEVNYIIFYAGFCYNAKRQAERTVELYHQYRDRVHFVVVDWSGIFSSQDLPPAQRELSLQYFHGDIPHTTILDRNGKAVFDYTGEADDATLIGWLDYALRSSPDSPTLAAEPAAPEKADPSSGGR